MGKPIGYMAFGYDLISGVVALHDYTGASIKDVHMKILEQAKSENYHGTIEQRLLELGWTIHQIYAYPLEVIGYITPTTKKSLDKGLGDTGTIYRIKGGEDELDATVPVYI